MRLILNKGGMILRLNINKVTIHHRYSCPYIVTVHITIISYIDIYAIYI